MITSSEPVESRRSDACPAGTVVFILGKDYHLGDLLWFTPVLSEYRRCRNPAETIVIVPDRPVSRILENNSEIDRLIYGLTAETLPVLRNDGSDAIHDLRPAAVALRMMLHARQRLPWLYYRDLWVQPRGQWLATYLGLPSMASYRPKLNLSVEDYAAAHQIPNSYVVLAPHIGAYSLPFLGQMWHRVKGWNWQNWTKLARLLRMKGYEVMTLGALAQEAVPETIPCLGLPIRQAAGVIGAAQGLITGESGLWFVAAALDIPFIIVPWWLPKSVDWPQPMEVPHRLVRREDASVDVVMAQFGELKRVPLHSGLME